MNHNRVNKRLPFTVIGGYLGAGKTTLLERLLQHEDTSRWLLLINDFGAVNIDAALISRSGVETVELHNGCVCCSIVDSLAATLLKALKADPPYSRIIVETSGVADPNNVAEIARLSRSMDLDKIIVVVDAESLLDMSDSTDIGQLVLQQLSSADLIVLNKLDLLDEQQGNAVRHIIRDRCPETELVETMYSEVPIDCLLQPIKTEAKSKLKDNPIVLQKTNPVFRSWSFQTELCFDQKKLKEVLAALPGSVQRIKGIVRLGTRPDQFYKVERTGKQHCMNVVTGFQADETVSQMVVIGLDDMPDDQELTQRFSSALITNPLDSVELSTAVESNNRINES